MLGVVDVDGCCLGVVVFLAVLGGIVVTDDDDELFLFSFNFSWISCKLVFDESCERIIPNEVEHWKKEENGPDERKSN